MKRVTMLFLCLALILGMSACQSATPPGPQDGVDGSDANAEKPRFVFVVPAASVAFWTAVEEGMQDAADKLGVELDVIGPNEMDVVKQVEFIEAEIANRPDAMSTVCVNENVYDDAINLAVEHGIPFVTMDGDAPNSNRSFYIGADTFEQGYLMCDKVAQTVGEDAKIGIITCNLTMEIVNQRIDGFKEAMKKYPEMEIVDLQESQTDPVKAGDKATAMLQTHPEINVLIGASSTEVAGIGRATTELGLVDKVFTGTFNDEIEGLDYLRTGAIDSIICIVPYEYGYATVEAMYHAWKNELDQFPADHLNVRSIEVTGENVDTYQTDAQSTMLSFEELIENTLKNEEIKAQASS